MLGAGGDAVVSSARLPHPKGSDVFQSLALRLHRLVTDEQSNNGTGTERFSVVSTSPLRIEHLGMALTLEEGDPDFTIGHNARQYIVQYGLTAGDMVWCLRERDVWHLIDVVEPGTEKAYRFLDDALADDLN